MPSPNEPRAHAGEVQQALLKLAVATRGVEDPADIGAVLGGLSSGLASLARSLHELGDFYDGPARGFGPGSGGSPASRAASYEVAWELHRAGEMIRQVTSGIDRAREIEATIAYDIRDCPALASPPSIRRPGVESGLSL